jgi:cell division protein FtsQ
VGWSSAAGAPVRHPLLAARRAAVARASGRRRLRRLLAVLGLGALVAGVLAGLHSPLLAARHVRVLGAAHTTPAQVLAVSGLGARPPLIDVDPGADAARVERLPWVATASVTRDWPDGVTVQVTERRPVAALPVAGGLALADATGRVLALASTRPAGVNEVLGVALATPTRPPRPGMALPAGDLPLLAVAAGLPGSLAAHVRWVQVASSGGVELRLDGGQTVELGSGAQLAEQSVALATLLAKVPMRGIVAIDLRVPDAPVLTR